MLYTKEKCRHYDNADKNLINWFMKNVKGKNISHNLNKLSFLKLPYLVLFIQYKYTFQCRDFVYNLWDKYFQSSDATFANSPKWNN